MKYNKKLLLVVGQRVKQFRASKGWSQEALGEKAKLHRTYIGSIERGERNISLINLERIALALGVQIAILINVID